MEVARAVAAKSAETTKVGAVVVDSAGAIVSVGFNHWGPCGLKHADEAALKQVPPNSTLYVTVAPCYACADLILLYDIKRVVCGPLHKDPKYKCAEGIQLLELHGVEVNLQG